MDWIEKLFHIAPDGGGGSLEFSVMIAAGLAVVMGLIGFAARRYVQHRTARLRLGPAIPLGHKAQK